MEPPLELHSDPEIQRPVSPELAVQPSLGKVTMENKLRNISFNSAGGQHYLTLTVCPLGWYSVEWKEKHLRGGER